MDAHGGRLAVEVLRRHGVDAMFTLSGGHLFVLYDGAVQADLRLVDVRHEQTATFAAEGWAKVTRRLGCAALTAGPGVTNGVSAMTAARHERFADGRARRAGAAAAVGRGLAAGARPRADRRAGRRRRAATATSAAVDRRRGRRRVPRRAHAAPRPDVRRHPARRRSARRSVEIPAVDGRAIRGADARSRRDRGGRRARRARPSGRCSSRAATCTGRAPKDAMRAFAEAARVPVFVNGMGRGTLPADHELAFARARSVALKEADLVLVAGTPLDFRLGFGRFGDAQVVHLCDAASEVARARRRSPRRRPATWRRRSPRSPTRARRPAAHDDWIARLRDDEQAKRAAERRRSKRDSVADQADAHLRRAAQAARPRRDRDR